MSSSYRRNPSPSSLDQSSARTRRLDVASQVGKTQLISGAVAAVGKRGRGAGFYCEACDLTFKDNIQLIEHYNTPQHLSAIGESGRVKRATHEEVRDRLLSLWRKREEERKRAEKDGVLAHGGRLVVAKIDIQRRIEAAQKKDEEEMEAKRQARRDKRARRKARN